MMTTIHEVYETVRDARADGPDALAAMALSYGATMVLGTVRCRALRGQIAELRAAQTAADEMRDAACAELKHALESTAETRAEVWRLRESVAALRAERDESQAAHEHTRAQWAAVCRERDEAQAERDALRSRPTYEARTVAPTIAEWRGHFRAGGSWIVLRPQWVPLVTILRGAARSTDDAPISGWTVTDGRLVREVSP